jgi:hypothetical protein
MGTGFTIDSPLKVARFGISSVVSLVDDNLVEEIRLYWAERLGEPAEPIGAREEDSRARRITAYMNLLNRTVAAQFAKLKAEPFLPGTEITRYFALLPEGALKQAYREMAAMPEGPAKASAQAALRERMAPGQIEANIMTKVDRTIYRDGQPLPVEHNDALAALRGFAMSDVTSSVVLSAGLHPTLYGYINHFADFLPDAAGKLRKRITLKVSDYRSALIQGKFLAKHGVWVSEYRVESGLNCGGHTFATTGYLMGPILEEFRENRAQLTESIMPLYVRGLKAKGIAEPAEAPPIRITVQGGIGSPDEQDLMLRYYEVDGTGWGTPFMLVPEATCMDEESMDLLQKADDKEVFLSAASPFGVPFWNLRHSPSEVSRRKRVDSGKPGTPCQNGFLMNNTELTERPICTASRMYQKLKHDELASGAYTDAQRAVLTEETLAKACICYDLAGSARRAYRIDPSATPCLCSGPNIVNFNRIYTLDEMVDHIYGRINLLKNSARPHVFINELRLYVDHLKAEIERYRIKLSARTPKYFAEFRENLMAGVEHYQKVAEQIIEEKKARFIKDLGALKAEIESIAVENMQPSS